MKTFKHAFVKSVKVENMKLAIAIPQQGSLESNNPLEVNERNYLNFNYMEIDATDSDSNISVKTMVDAFTNGQIVILIEESLDDATSPNYLTSRQSASFQHHLISKGIESTFAIQQAVPGIGGAVSLPREYEGYNCDYVYAMETGEFYSESNYGLAKGFKEARTPYQEVINELLFNGFDLLMLLSKAVVVQTSKDGVFGALLDLSYSSAGQKRKGDLDGLVVASSLPGQQVKTPKEFLEETGFEVELFGKHNKEKETVEIDGTKAVTRFKLAGSSSHITSVFDNFGKAVKIETKAFKSRNEDGSRRMVDVVYVTGESGQIIAISPDDFTVYNTHSILASAFHNNGELSMETREDIMIERPATDGMMLVDGGIMNDVAEELEIDQRISPLSAVQVRLYNSEKGLALRHNHLKQLLGCDLFLFGGSVKGDALRHIREGKVAFNVVNINRRLKTGEVGRVSRQAYINLFSNRINANAFRDVSLSVWEKALTLDKESIFSLLGAKEDVSLEELIAESETDQLTKKFVEASVNLVLSSAEMKKKLLNLLRSVSKDFTNGKFVYIPDTAYRYLAVDVETIVDYMSEGIIGVHHEVDKKRGLKPGKVVLAEAYESNGIDSIRLAQGESILIRFPNLHADEIRKVKFAYSADDFYDGEKGLFRYERAIRSKQYHGIIMFSLWDMEAEGMSGADFDGDICLVIKTPELVSIFDERPLFLDFSLVEDEQGSWELISGCPFVGEKANLSLEQTLLYDNESILEFTQLGMTMDGTKISIPTSSISEKYDKTMTTLDKLFRSILRSTLKGNDIGVLTNILGTITEAKMEATACKRTAYINEQKEISLGNTEKASKFNDYMNYFDKEISRLAQTEYYLAVAIRWEIDSAKHGGAYRKQMPFIDLLVDGTKDYSQIIEMEEKFNIGLQRVFISRQGSDK